jgi:hypothetical protein
LIEKERKKKKAGIQHAFSPGLKKFNPEEVEREAKQCVVDARTRRNDAYAILLKSKAPC